jgi:trehalose-phosphatase
MKILSQTVDLEAFFSHLGKSSSNTLFLDYDGTLAPFNVDPGKAVPYKGIRQFLQQLMDCKSTRLVIVTGRSTLDIIPLLDMEEIPEIWGSHGLERLKPDGDYAVEPFSDRTRHFLEQAKQAANSPKGEARLEEKPGCVALHWRGLEPDTIKKISERISPLWKEIAQKGQLTFKTFDGGLEVRVPGKNKGDAVNEILKEIPADSITAYLGDDLTDEDAFAALEGRGLRVLVRTEYRQTKADIWIQPPEELFTFLNRWLEACQ